ncbi:hypothetical protein CEXT_627351 [Caerostris extrusa]|uniref:Uncharacterized protein n=1 Tax=Caerostris extrusa TaxID=172846 RepID=A0AAV4SNK7_CAEEX|nr:hypothetical protein CEXT_627351 [Caerostris extrusa]
MFAQIFTSFLLKSLRWFESCYMDRCFSSGSHVPCIIVMYVKGVDEAGGIAEVYKKAVEGQRVNLFE